MKIHKLREIKCLGCFLFYPASSDWSVEY
jgi:hypothetical protein